MGDEAMDKAAGAADAGARHWHLDAVELLAPVPVPPKVMAIGMNYGPRGRDGP